ncbi:MAG: prepilin-type N-terminal cleavage/methylation domain-containing protein [Patescibacteria group bacterium]|nr:prepilin-type N-terminal cleavage/methylation domain-containing protein [Patescibacteria group bacterium]
MKYKQGFTLIEIIIVIAVIFFLVSTSIVSYRYFEKSTELEKTTQNIITTLKLAQAKTTSSEEASQYGVHFENDKYILFKGDEYQPESEDNKIYNISNRLEIEGNDIIFQRISGKTEQNGNVSIRTISNPSSFKIIDIKSSGIIELSNIIECCQTNRLTDTRHIHLNLGWSIQDSTILTLSSTNINMIDYFNIDQTEFDWSGTIVVNEENQELQIHTHLLNETNTILCIHRPKDKNNKLLDILIDSNDIISYDVSGEISIGSYGGALEIQ